MGSKTNITSSPADAVSSAYGDSSLPLPTESSLVSVCQGISVKEVTSGEPEKDPGNVLSKPYPSPPVEPDSGLMLMQSSCPTLKTADRADNDVVSVSTSFNPTSHSTKPDLLFNTSDMVLFYAHSHVLGKYSSEAFSRVLRNRSEKNQTSQVMAGPEIIYDVPDPSTVFTIILHTLYGTSPAQNLPSFEALMTAVNRMPFYNIDPKDIVTRQTPLYQLLLSHAPLFPLQLYTLAGRHGIEDLAVASSSHLLSFPISSLRDEMAVEMGASYLKRLFCLHFTRVDTLKQMLLVPPHPHPPTKECDFSEQRGLTRAWALAAANLAWDSRPDLSTSSIRGALQPLAENMTCELCRAGLEKRINEIVNQWASVKPTI